MQHNSKVNSMKNNSHNQERRIYVNDKGSKFNKPKRGKNRIYSEQLN